LVLGPKKGFKLACNWSSNFKHLAIVSLQTQAKLFLAAGIPVFTLDIQTRISWASDIKIKRFKSPNLYTRPGLQLWWRVWSEIKSFSRTESGSNLVGQKGSPDLIQKLTMPSIPIWLRVWPKNKSTKFVTEIESLVQNSGQDPSRSRILYFHVRYSNRNIMSFWYRNQAIQKS